MLATSHNLFSRIFSRFLIMVDSIVTRNIATTVVSIILLLTYSYFFGQKSIQRYLEGKIIITEHEEKPLSIPPPGKNDIDRYRQLLK